MKIVIATLSLMLVAASFGDGSKGDKEDTKSLTEINQKLEELSKKVSDLQNADAEHRRKIKHLEMKNEDLQKADAERRREIAALKVKNIELRKTEAILRKADAELRKADERILEDREKEEEQKELRHKKEARRRANSIRQKDVEGAVKKMIVEEIRKYNAAHNKTEDMKKLIISEIRNYHANAEIKRIAIVNGKAKNDGPHNPDYPSALKAFGDSTFCTGWDGTQYKRAFPHLIWYEFPTLHVPAKFSFTHYSSGNRDDVKTWKFVASGDDNCDQASNWVELCGDLSGTPFTKIASCDVPKYARGSYRCLGIRIYSNQVPNNNGGCLSQMRFWEV